MRRRAFLLGAASAAASAMARARAMTPEHLAIVAGPAKSPPLLDLNFVNGSNTLDPRISFSRASGATYFDASGTLQTAATNVPRFDYGPTPGGRTNWIRNSTMQGAAVGGFTLPTYWADQGGMPTGMTKSIIGVGTENGIPYIDIKFAGTATSGGNCLVTPETYGVIPIAFGQPMAASAYLKMVDMTALGDFSGFGVNVRARDAGSTTFPGGVASSPSAPFTLGNDLSASRFSVSWTPDSELTATVFMRFVFLFNSGVTYNFTVRIGAPQLEIGAPVATAWIPTSGSIVTVGAAPQGLLIEDTRANLIRNGNATGAVIGTPGTLPTNWAQSQNTSIVPAVVGTGVESGIPFVDLQFVGTASGSNNNLFFVPNFSVSAGPSQPYSVSFYWRLVGGSFANVPAIFWLVGDNISDAPQAQMIGPTSAGLATQRKTVTFTTNSGAVTGLKLGIQFQPNPGGAINFTVRIGGAQAELGPFATSYIPTTGSTSATRAAELAAMPVGPWFNPMAGTFSGDVVFAATPSSALTQTVAMFSNGAATNRMKLLYDGTVARYRAVMSAAGASVFDSLGLSSQAVQVGATGKIALAWSPAGVLFAANPGSGPNAPVNASLSALPGGITTLNLGTDQTGINALNATLRRVRYWPRALSASELQQASR